MLNSEYLRRLSVIGIFLLSMTGLAACEEEADVGETGTATEAPATAEQPNATTEEPAATTEEPAPTTEEPATTTTE